MALNPKSYCAYVQDLPADHLHRKYHDRQYGFPLEDDNALFGRLILEINQAGLSWITILKKQDNFKAAFAGYDINTVAAFDEEDDGFRAALHLGDKLLRPLVVSRRLPG